MDDSDLTSSQKEDPDYVKTRCLHYMNKLVEGLGLDIPTHFEELGQIKVPHLVEIHCRLVGINFSEYTPNPDRPWKDIEDLILSLQDRYGSNNFHHLNALLIATYNPKHILCLLQVFNEIYDYHVRKGRILPTPRNADSTILASSYHDTDPDISMASSSSSKSIPYSEAHGHTQSSSNLAATDESQISSASSATFKEHVFKIPFTDSELDSDVEHIDVDIDLKGDSFESFNDSSSVLDETDQPSGYSGGNEEATLRGPQERPSQSRIPKTQSTQSVQSSKKTKIKKGHKLEKDKRPTAAVGVASSPGPRNKSIPTTLVASSSSLVNFEKENDPNADSQLESEPEPESQIPIDNKRSTTQVWKRPSWCDRLNPGPGPGPSVQRKPKAQRCDEFGNPIKKKFPYYASSIIKPTCHPSSFIIRRKKNKPSWHDLNQKRSVEKHGEAEDKNAGSDGKKATRKLSSTICSKILKQVLRDMPNVHLDKSTLKELHGKCKGHLRSIAKVAFDEESIYNQMEDKMKLFLDERDREGKKSQLSMQNKE